MRIAGLVVLAIVHNVSIAAAQRYESLSADEAVAKRFEGQSTANTDTPTAPLSPLSSSAA